MSAPINYAAAAKNKHEQQQKQQHIQQSNLNDDKKSLNNNSENSHDNPSSDGKPKSFGSEPAQSTTTSSGNQKPRDQQQPATKPKKDFNVHAFFTTGGQSTQTPPPKSQNNSSNVNNNNNSNNNNNNTSSSTPKSQNDTSLRMNAQSFTPHQSSHRQHYQPRNVSNPNRGPQNQRSPQPPQQQQLQAHHYPYPYPAYYDPSGYYVSAIPPWQQYSPQAAIPPTSPSTNQVPLPSSRGSGPSPPTIPTTPRMSATSSPRPAFTPSVNAPVFSPPSATSPPPASGISPAPAFAIPPKKSAAVKIKTSSGENVDLESFKQHKRQSSSIQSTASVEQPTDPSTLVKAPPRTPIRIESESDKAKRLESEQNKDKAKVDEENKKVQEAEKKKMEEEKKVALEESKKREEKAKKEAEEKAKKEAEEKAKKEAEEKIKRESEEKARKEAEEKAKKESEEKARSESEAKAAEEKSKQEQLKLKEINTEELNKNSVQTLAEEKIVTEGKTPETSFDNAKKDVPKGEKELNTKLAPSNELLATPSIGADKLPSKIDTSSPTLEQKPAQKPSVALGSARRINDLNKVSYPGDIIRPKPELNKRAQPGKFRYDRDFLMQFMKVFTDKPSSMPSLDAIGLEPDQGMGFGGRSSSGRSGRAGGMGPSKSGGFGGKSGFGQFNEVSSRGTSSAERFARSQAMGAFSPGTPMSRTSSSRGGTAREGSSGGKNRSQRGKQRGEGGPPGKGGVSNTPLADAMGPITPLQKTENAWTPAAIKNRVAGIRPGINVDESSPEFIEKKVKGLLNKLTIDKFESISNQILEFANKSENEEDGRTLRQVIKLIFDKATDEAVWSEMYARLCRKLLDSLSDKIVDKSQQSNMSGGLLFRKYLLTRCQEDFERGWSDKEATSKAANAKAEEDEAKRLANEKAETSATDGSAPKTEAQQLSDEYYAAQKAKRRGLGLVRFIGELFKLQMLTSRVMHICIKRLLTVQPGETIEEEEIESLAKLLTTVGSLLETEQAKPNMDVYFTRMEDIVKDPKTSSRMEFMLLDVIELRQNNWVSRHKDAGPKSIAQIHKDVANQRTQSAADANIALSRGVSGRGGVRTESSRGSSRRGQARNAQEPENNTNSGGDGWNTIGKGQLGGNAGQYGQSSGKPSQQNAQQFGPGSAFNRKGGRQGTGSATHSPSGIGSPLLSEGKSPAVSRTNSTANMFSLLEAQEQANEEQPQQRKKLNLLPRTKPTEEGGESKENKEEITDKKAKQMVKTMTEEFYELKKVTEGLESFKELPMNHRNKLIESVIDKAMNGKKETVDLTSDLISKAREQSLITQEQLEAEFGNIIEFIEDISIDVPNAYKFMGQLMSQKASKLDNESIDRLLSKIPKSEAIQQPKDKIQSYINEFNS